MSKNYTTLFLALGIMMATTSCNQYRSLGSVTKLSQLSGNPFYFNLTKSLLKNTGNFLSTSGIKPDSKLGLLTPLTSVLKTGDQMSGFKNMLASTYQVYPQKLEKGFGSIGNMKDVVSFVASNGRNFKF
jgi:hypothetical protein